MTGSYFSQIAREIPVGFAFHWNKLSLKLCWDCSVQAQKVLVLEPLLLRVLGFKNEDKAGISLWVWKIVLSARC